MDKKKYKEIYKKIKRIKKDSLSDFIDYLCQSEEARQICNVSSIKLSATYPLINLNEFETKLFEKKYFKENKYVEFEKANIELNELAMEKLLADDFSLKKEQNSTKNINHLKNVEENKKIDLNFIQKYTEKNNFNKIKESLHVEIINLFNEIIDNIVFIPKFSLDYFNNKYINFLYDRKHNINDYKKLKDFFKNYIGEAAMDSENFKWKSLDYKEIYQSEINQIIEDNIYIKKENKNYIKKKLFDIIENLNIKDVFYLYDIEENKKKYNIALNNSKKEEEINKVIDELINNINNIENKKILLFVDSSEEYIPPSEKFFDITDYCFFKEIKTKDIDKLKSNFGNYYCDAHNLNLFIILEKTNILSNDKKVIKLNAFYLYNKNIQKIKKEKIDLSIIPNKLIDNYKIILKD